MNQKLGVRGSKTKMDQVARTKIIQKGTKHKAGGNSKGDEPQGDEPLVGHRPGVLPMMHQQFP